MPQRRYPTVSVREGYREWLPSYGATVQDEMDLVLLAALESVRWAAVERTADLGYETGHRFVDMAFANGSGAEALACLRDVAGRPRGAGRIDEYLRVAERLLAEEPHNIEPARDIARGYIVRGNGRYALARLKMCFDKEPRTPRPSICWPRHSSFAVRTTRRRPCWSRSAASIAIRAAPRSRRTPFTARSISTPRAPRRSDCSTRCRASNAAYSPSSGRSNGSRRGEQMTELAMLAEALAHNKWVSDIGMPAPRRKS